MSKTLGGFLFVKDGFRYDYCFQESVNSLLEFCDQVSVCYVESSDNTLDALKEIQSKSDKLIITELGIDEWNAHQGKEKLAHFQNIAITQLTTDYQFLQQADEIIHESCYPMIRKAIEADREGYLVSRINLWGSPYTQLNVPQNRKPCSTEVIRISKTGRPTYGDGESINAQCVDWFLKDIRLFHLGYVRNKKIHPLKIREMQGNIFQCGVDEKLNGMDEFDWTKWFAPEDLKPIEEPLPRIIQDWAVKRM